MTAPQTQAQTQTQPAQRTRLPYIDGNQAVQLLDIYTQFAHAVGGKRTSKLAFEVRIDDDNFMRFGLDGTVETVGVVPLKPEANFTVTGPYSYKEFHTPGKKGSTVADKLGMAVLFEISTMWDKAQGWVDRYNATEDKRELTDKAISRAKAGYDLIGRINDFGVSNNFPVHPMELVAARGLTIAK